MLLKLCKSTTTGSSFCGCSSTASTSSCGASSMVSPRSAAFIPLKMISKPIPPESTTPAFFKTGNKSGVEASAISPASIIFAKNCSKSLTFWFCADAAIKRQTVKIVPSFGLETAAYAVSVAAFIALTKSLMVISFKSRKLLQRPLKICEVITPELPLAPRSAPLETRSQISLKRLV